MTAALANGVHHSPSLGRSGGGEGLAYELKFLVDDARALEAEAWARRALTLDIHADAALGGAYRTVSLYCDTPELDVFHRRAPHERSKFRIRRYGTSPGVFLERKLRWGDRVAKRRAPVAAEELSLLAEPAPLPSWPGDWFHRRLRARRLRPACLIEYQRAAYFGMCSEGRMRLTLDRQVRGAPTHRWELGPLTESRLLLEGAVILELKFHAALPAPFKRLVQDLRLSPRPVSKYGLCWQAWGLAATPRELTDA